MSPTTRDRWSYQARAGLRESLIPPESTVRAGLRQELSGKMVNKAPSAIINLRGGMGGRP